MQQGQGQQLQQRLLLVIQFFIVHVSVPVFIGFAYLMTFTQQRLGKGYDLGLTPEQWEGGVIISEPEFDEEPIHDNDPRDRSDSEGELGDVFLTK